MTVDRIGERLRRYRRAAKKTLHQVASESGLTASFLSQAERNLTGVSISSLANIAKSLNIPLQCPVRPTGTTPARLPRRRAGTLHHRGPAAGLRTPFQLLPRQPDQCGQDEHAGGLPVGADLP
ncbi:helix-turn-helix transcriptional regulator [Pseudomonas aeruginosa]|nr:helix-turn-helix transcriptional regulator [Pseudomonas aeruginosa]